mgnify:CR=1 FL=1
MVGMKNLRKALMPVGLSLLAVTVFMGCRAEIAVRGRSYSDRVWNSDPYCTNYGYGSSYGCRYGYNDGVRIDFIQRRRWGGGWRNIEASTLTAAKPTTWEAEFKLKPRAVAFMKNSFNNALEGKTEQLQAIGISHADIQRLAAFEMPSNESINTAARSLNVKSQDMKDFLEVFTIRMKAAFEANE